MQLTSFTRMDIHDITEQYRKNSKEGHLAWLARVCWDGGDNILLAPYEGNLITLEPGLPLRPHIQLGGTSLAEACIQAYGIQYQDWEEAPNPEWADSDQMSSCLWQLSI